MPNLPNKTNKPNNPPPTRVPAGEKKPAKPSKEYTYGPWLSMRSGLIVISIASVVMAVLTAYQSIPIKGTVGGILWGLAFGAGIWVVFWGYLMFNKWLQRK